MSDVEVAAHQALLLRLRDLALVELDAITPDGDPAMVALVRDDLLDALRAARERARELGRRLGVDPAGLLDAPARVRVQAGAAAAAARLGADLAARASAARDLARLDDLTAPLVPMLLALDRRLGG
ncbi:MAG: hypothetical protein KA190_12350 [Kofleriaceae bacterium]|nr:hypothetical protein [Kofleriaceae bacterium]